MYPLGSLRKHVPSCLLSNSMENLGKLFTEEQIKRNSYLRSWSGTRGLVKPDVGSHCTSTIPPRTTINLPTSSLATRRFHAKMFHITTNRGRKQIAEGRWAKCFPIQCHHPHMKNSVVQKSYIWKVLRAISIWKKVRWFIRTSRISGKKYPHCQSMCGYH